MTRGLRIVVVVAIGALELAAFLMTALSYQRPVAEFGYNIGWSGTKVVAVEPGLAAAKAGIATGDRIVYEQLPRIGRLSVLLNETVEPGTVLNLTVVRDGVPHAVSMVAQALPELYGAVDLSFAAGGLALGFVALALALMRPSRMTWGFVLVAPPLLLPESLYLWGQRAPSSAGLAFEIVVALLYAMQITGMLLFAARFPNDRADGFANVVDRLAIPAGIVAFAIYAYVDVAIWFSSAPPASALLFAQDYVTEGLPTLVALIALCATFATSQRSDRSRLGPTIAAFVLLILTGLLQQFGSQATSNPGQLAALNLAFAFSSVLVAIAVAYGVVRHRVIDVDFIVSRTLVYTILTMFAVGVFALIEYLVGKLLEEGRLASMMEILAAIAIGVSMNYLHNRLDKFIDVVLFRRRHLAEARLERAAATLPHANATALVEEMLVSEPVDAFDLASAAVFRRTGNDNAESYVRVKADGWESAHAAELDGDDHLVVRLRAELQAVAIGDMRWPRADLPQAAAQPLYAVPIGVGHRLEAFALYGAHRSGEDLDPDERGSLRGLAAAAALAYDHLIAQDLRARLERAEAENAALRQVEQKLTDLVAKHLS